MYAATKNKNFIFKKPLDVYENKILCYKATNLKFNVITILTHL